MDNKGKINSRLLKKYAINNYRFRSVSRFVRFNKFYEYIFMVFASISIISFLLAMFFSNIELYDSLKIITVNTTAVLFYCVIPVLTMTYVYFLFMKKKISFNRGFQENQQYILEELSKSGIEVESKSIKNRINMLYYLINIVRFLCIGAVIVLAIILAVYICIPEYKGFNLMSLLKYSTYVTGIGLVILNGAYIFLIRIFPMTTSNNK